MIVHYSEIYPYLSDEAVQQVIEQAPGKPVNDEQGNKIGIVIKAVRGVKSKVVDYEIETV